METEKATLKTMVFYEIYRKGDGGGLVLGDQLTFSPRFYSLEDAQKKAEEYARGTLGVTYIVKKKTETIRVESSKPIFQALATIHLQSGPTFSE